MTPKELRDLAEQELEEAKKRRKFLLALADATESMQRADKAINGPSESGTE